jgi:aminomethyltransferase
MAAGEAYGMEFSSTRSMTIRRIEAGILGNMTDMDTTMTPFQAGLGPFIDMGKDDFIGRAALVDADRRALMYGVRCNNAVPGRGSVVLDGQEPVAVLTAGVDSPTLGCGIGYARFQKPGEWSNRELKVRLPDASVHPCTVVDLPFVDPERLIARGLDRTIP